MSTAQINRYITREVLAPTLLSLLIFTMVLLMGRLMKLVDLVINKGVSIGEIVALFATMLPTFLNVTLPLAFLMGIMIGLSRMSADSETIAMKAVGIGLGQIARPVILLALICAILSGIASLWLKPWGYKEFRDRVFAITMQKTAIGFQEQVFMNQFNDLVLYANQLDGRSGLMEDLLIVDSRPDASALILAEQGRVLADEEEGAIHIQLKDGTIHRRQDKDASTYQLIHFENYDVQPDLSENGDSTLKQRGIKIKELSTGELWETVTGSRTEEGGKRFSAIQSELHARLVTPLAPILFALFALPFSIQSHRSGRSGGFVIGLVIYLCYYMLFSLAQTMTADAGISPWLSFWLPHLLLVTGGLYCLRQSAHEQPNLIVLAVEQAYLGVRSRLNRIDENT